MPIDPIQSAIPACSSCAAPQASALPFCDACGRVQPPQGTATYFDLFGLPRKLAIDTAALEKNFYRISRKLHPDMFARATAEEQSASLAQSSLLNDAYRTLKHPVSRTEYLLKLEGIAIADDAGNDAARDNRVPPDLLEEVFDLNMQLEEMRMSAGSGEDVPALRTSLESAKAQFESQLATVDSQLEALWSAWDTALDAGDTATMSTTKDGMAALLDRRRYIRNLVRDVTQVLAPTPA